MRLALLLAATAASLGGCETNAGSESVSDRPPLADAAAEVAAQQGASAPPTAGRSWRTGGPEPPRTSGKERQPMAKKNPPRVETPEVETVEVVVQVNGIRTPATSR